MTDLVRPVRVLQGHVSPETAFVVDDYPYGRRLRCKIRYWVERADKGAKKGQMRMVSQTTNPKDGDRWNKPKGGTYTDLVWLYQVDDEGADDNGHIKHVSASLYLNPAHDARLHLMGVHAGMTPSQRERYVAIRDRVRQYAEPWQGWESLVARVRAHLAVYGQLPERDGKILFGNKYVDDWDWRVLATIALKGRGPDGATHDADFNCHGCGERFVDPCAADCRRMLTDPAAEDAAV